mmetsp:Transcript_39580/g.125844  ORF Transcript_39580/g.125844 Transcript_39580/m.125844 type:complete len:142 (+) Transcript_39580:753-1178(+)
MHPACSGNASSTCGHTTGDEATGSTTAGSHATSIGRAGGDTTSSHAGGARSGDAHDDCSHTACRVGSRDTNSSHVFGRHPTGGRTSTGDHSSGHSSCHGSGGSGSKASTDGTIANLAHAGAAACIDADPGTGGCSIRCRAR